MAVGRDDGMSNLGKRFDLTDARLDKIEVHHSRNVYIFLGLLFGMFLVLAGMMAKGFHWL